MAVSGINPLPLILTPPTPPFKRLGIFNTRKGGGVMLGGASSRVSRMLVAGMSAFRV